MAVSKKTSCVKFKSPLEGATSDMNDDFRKKEGHLKGEHTFVSAEADIKKAKGNSK